LAGYIDYQNDYCKLVGNGKREGRLIEKFGNSVFLVEFDCDASQMPHKFRAPTGQGGLWRALKIVND